MNKLLMMFLAITFCSGVGYARAEEYAVRKDDCLSMIGKQLRVSWREIAKKNKVKGPEYVIYVGQRLTIPRPVAAQTVAVQESTQYLEKILSLQARILELEQKYNEAIAAMAKKELEAAAAVKKEKTLASVITTETSETKVQTGASEVQETAGTGRVDDATGVAEVAGASAGAAGVSTVYSVKTTGTILTNVYSARNGRVIGGPTDMLDLLLHGGIYTTATGPDGQGTYFGGRFRVRPFFFSNIADSDLNLGLGSFFFASYVNGEAGNNKNSDKSGYNKMTLTGGPSAKLYGKGWDVVGDLGVGGVWEYGGKGKYAYDQSMAVFNPFLWGTYYQRRLKNEPWFAKTEAGFGSIFPIAGSATRDMRTGELYFTQWIYDYKINKEVRLSTGLETSLGYDKGGSGTNFYRLGPALSLEYKNQSVFALSLGYKEKLGATGDLWLVNGSVNVGNIVKLVKASRITEPTNSDLTVNK